jgi:2-dehydro-3-deoxyphosphogluconate aldolase/(4S)-4-hydroxy-2-oxoglutarate aldolase
MQINHAKSSILLRDGRTRGETSLTHRNLHPTLTFFPAVGFHYDRSSSVVRGKKAMSKEQQLARVIETGIVAVIRASSGDLLADVADALLAGGVDVMEVTFTVPGAVKVLERVADRLGSRVLLGAGTVLDPETARAALLAGAEFIVAPNTNLEVIRLCRRYSKLVMPGAFTPTEVVTAWEAGADIVKVFPADFTGPAHLKVLHGPLPQIRLMPTGGVTLDTAADFLKAGACALGVGSALVEKKAVEAGDFARIEALAKQFVAIVRETRKKGRC